MLECYDFEECEYNAQPKCCLPNGMECSHGVKAHKPTNADRIRAMSDEELADWAINKAPNIGKCYTDSRLGVLDWLQQPAEEDT